MNSTPLITIITSTFNAAKELPLTANSIRAQSHRAIQWIVADGGSKDGTVDVIQANSDIVDTWFSEPDRGIYDAWNKAIPHVRGEWVQFLGAGDELASPDALDQIAKVLRTAHPRHDIVYGKLLFVSEKSRLPLEEVGRPWSEMKGRWIGFRPVLPIHPEVFHHSSIMRGANTFDLRFRIGGDSHFLLQHVLEKEPLYAPILIDRMPLGGASGTISAAWRSAKEIRAINRELGIHPPLLHSIAEWIKLAMKMAVVKIAPSKLTYSIADLYRMLAGKPRRWFDA